MKLSKGLNDDLKVEHKKSTNRITISLTTDIDSQTDLGGMRTLMFSYKTHWKQGYVGVYIIRGSFRMLQFLKQLLSYHFGSTVYNRAKVYNVNFLKVVVIIIDQWYQTAHY